MPKLIEQLVEWRRDIHQHPELSWNEKNTAAKVTKILKGLGLSPKEGVAGTGVTAEIRGKNPKATVALRADMDALPITEETGLPFASQVEGVMHACGHDGHTAILLGAAQLLSQDPPPVNVRLLFQPGEETGQGAPKMIEEGVLDGVDYIFGAHLDRHFPVGKIIVTPGTVNASSDAFRIHIEGRGGHGARPHEAIDAVVVGSLIVMAIQTIVSREINPAHPSVVTVGTFDAGSAPNVISAKATLQGTIRAQDSVVRRQMIDSVQRIARSVGDLHGATTSVHFSGGTPEVKNSTEMVEFCRQTVAKHFGDNALAAMTTANMGGEDFGYYLQKTKGAYLRIGGQLPGSEGFPAHSSRFDFDEGALEVGARFFQLLAREAGENLLR